MLLKPLFIGGLLALTLLSLVEGASTRIDKWKVRGKSRYRRVSHNDFISLVDTTSATARLVSAVSLQNGIMNETIPPTDALAELLKIGAVDVEKLQTFNKDNVRSALKALDQLQPRLISTAEGDKLEATIILLDSWRQKHEKVGDVKDIKLAKEYYAAVEKAQGKTFKHVFTQVTASSIQSFISTFTNILLTIQQKPMNEDRFLSQLSTLNSYFTDIESFTSGLSNSLASLRQFDDLTRRDFVVDSPQRHYIDLLNDIEATKSSIVSGNSAAAQTQIANTVNKVHTEFSEAASTDLFHLAEIVSSQSHNGHKSLIYTSGLPNGYLDLGKLDGDVNNPAIKPLLGKFSPTDLQNGFAPLKTLTSDAIDLHQAWSPLNQSESVDAWKQLDSLTRWFGALKSPIKSATVTSAASFGEKSVPSLRFSTNFAKSIEKSIKLRSTLLSVRQRAEVLENSTFVGNLSLLSELKKFLPNSPINDVTKVPQLMAEFKKFKDAQNLLDALNGLKPMVQDIYDDLVNVNITQTIKDISGGQTVLENFVGHSDAGAVNNYLTELTNSEVKSVAEMVQLVQQIRVFTKKSTFDQQVLKMANFIASSIPKVKTLVNAIKAIVTDQNPDATKLKELKISEEDSKNFGDAVMLLNNIQKFLEKEGDFETVLEAETVKIVLPLIQSDGQKKKQWLDSWGDFDGTKKTVKFTFADMKTRINSISTSSISKFADYKDVFNKFNGLHDLNLEMESRGTVLEELAPKANVTLILKMNLEKLDAINLHFASSSTSLSLLPQTLANLDQAFQFVAQQQTLVIPPPIQNSSAPKPDVSQSKNLFPEPEESSSNPNWVIFLVIGIVVVFLIAGCIWYFLYFKKAKKSQQMQDPEAQLNSHTTQSSETSPNTFVATVVDDRLLKKLHKPKQITVSVEEVTLQRKVRAKAPEKPNIEPKKETPTDPKSEPKNEPDENYQFSNRQLIRYPQETNPIKFSPRIINQVEKDFETFHKLLRADAVKNNEERGKTWLELEEKQEMERKLTTAREPSEKSAEKGGGSKEGQQEVQGNQGGSEEQMATCMDSSDKEERKEAGKGSREGWERSRSLSPTKPLLPKNNGKKDHSRERHRRSKSAGGKPNPPRIVIKKDDFVVPPEGISRPVSPEELDDLYLPKLLRDLLTSGGSKRLDIPFSRVMTLLKLVQNRFMENRKALIDITEGDYRVMGDIHGNFHALLQHLSVSGLPHEMKSICLGDYVDRGKMSLEVVCLLFLFKIVYGDRVVLIRGNHETPLVNLVYGFSDELLDRYGPAGDKMYIMFNEVFSWMPVAAVAAKKVLLVHGGISAQAESLDMVRSVQLPLVDFTNLSFVLDMLWSDPSGPGDFIPNKDRGTSCCFGVKATKKFFKNNDLSLIVRGHQVATDGVMKFADGRVLTVFSAPNYQNRNSGAAIFFDKNLNISGHVLVPKGRDNLKVPNVVAPPSTVF